MYSEAVGAELEAIFEKTLCRVRMLFCELFYESLPAHLQRTSLP